MTEMRCFWLGTEVFKRKKKSIVVSATKRELGWEWSSFTAQWTEKISEKEIEGWLECITNNQTTSAPLKPIRWITRVHDAPALIWSIVENLLDRLPVTIPSIPCYLTSNGRLILRMCLSALKVHHAQDFTRFIEDKSLITPWTLGNLYAILEPFLF